MLRVVPVLIALLCSAAPVDSFAQGNANAAEAQRRALEASRQRFEGRSQEERQRRAVDRQQGLADELRRRGDDADRAYRLRRMERYGYDRPYSDMPEPRVEPLNPHPRPRN